jgi:hypothetical protein
VSHQPDYTPTPDRRYFVVRGRLWRLSNPSLSKAIHSELVQELMAARRAVRDGKNSVERIAARLKVDAAKRKLGERGPAWWADGAPDYNRCLAVNTPYASWFRGARARKSRDALFTWIVTSQDGPWQVRAAQNANVVPPAARK